MSEGIDAYIKKKFEVPDVDIRTYSPLTLAYIGDGVFDLVIRSVVVGKGNTRPNQLHHRTSQIVKAHTQAVRELFSFRLSYLSYPFGVFSAIYILSQSVSQFNMLWHKTSVITEVDRFFLNEYNIYGRRKEV